jgi:serine phosphatase RsbU (regulator of sigma subunit)
MKTVLVVEDELSIARGLCDNLEAEGYRALRENDGRKGYERARLEKPDLVILDVMLPSMDGFSICTKLKEAGFGAPIFLLTGLTAEDSKLQGLQNGADDYIEKPFNLQELLLRVRNALKRRDASDDMMKEFNNDLLQARKIQMDSLPRSQPRLRRLDVCGKTVPANQVGGDYFDYLKPGKSRFGIIVADVSGKGLPAAMHVQKVQGIVQSNAAIAASAPELLKRVQEHMGPSLEPSFFITAVIAYFDFDAMEMEIVRAGHLPALLLRNRRIRQLKPRGIWIGGTSKPAFEEVLRVQKLPLQPGDIILFYSDGFTEARNERGNEFGLLRLTRCMLKGSRLDATSLVDHCFRTVRLFSGEETQVDDMTVVAVRVIQPNAFKRRNVHEKNSRRRRRQSPRTRSHE